MGNRMHRHAPIHHSWREVLAAPAPASHILQLHDGREFLAAAVAHFAAAGLTRGEAVLLSGTGEHLRSIDRELAALDVDTQGLRHSGQLIATDIEVALEQIAPRGVLDRARFEALTYGTLERVRGRWSGVRWWGEITSTLYQRGAREAGRLAEQLADTVAEKHGVTVFCSYLCDKYQAQSYDDVLDMCCLHSHVIPAEDYVQHRLTVNRAIAEVVGDLRGSLLQSLTSWKAPECNLPSSQAALFWLRDTLPEKFEAVLERARSYQLEERRAS